MPDPYVLEIELPEDSQRDLSQILQSLSLRGDNAEHLGEAIGAALSTEATLLRETNGGEGKVMIVYKDGTQRQVLLQQKGETVNGGRAGHR